MNNPMNNLLLDVGSMQSHLETNKLQIIQQEHKYNRNEPKISFCYNYFYVNAYCIKEFFDCNYIQILIDPIDKKIILKPCVNVRKDAFRWVGSGKHRVPLKVKSELFLFKLFNLMEWNVENRYVCFGAIEKSGNENIIIFNLYEYYAYQNKSYKPNSVKIDCNDDDFGIALSSYHDSIQMHRFSEDKIFFLKKKCKGENNEENE